ncbi:unnamed protein product [Miscanthus lutarioriparius]|uniref:Uncharacterized protein n=1 Tax=Miscanthus lutarioriparius TaxID=422564 RepID=A0A811RRC9_9POAL|nr:unnamed protein product [Miscanthus lutarioriparius]
MQLKTLLYGCGHNVCLIAASSLGDDDSGKNSEVANTDWIYLLDPSQGNAGGAPADATADGGIQISVNEAESEVAAEVSDAAPKKVVPDVTAPVVQSPANMLPVLVVEKPKLQSIIIKDTPAVTVAHGLFPAAPSAPPQDLALPIIRKVLNFLSKTPRSCPFASLTLLNIDFDTVIPPYFNDPLILAHLALLLPPQIMELAEGLNNLLDEEDDLFEIIAEEFTPRKRRATRAKEQIDDRFLRRSKRHAVKNQGYKAPPVNRKEKEIPSPMPLACILAPGASVAPHLTENIVHGIATGFLQIQPSALSAAILMADVNEDHN